jgi:hypothetical protein
MYLSSNLFQVSVFQAAVWTLLVVTPFATLHLSPRLIPAHRHALFAQPTVETFDARVLRRLSRLDMHQLDLSFHHARNASSSAPARCRSGSLAPVRAGPRFASSKRVHSSTGKAGVHFQTPNTPAVSIHHAQHADRPLAIHRIVHEIQRPFLVRRRPSSERRSGLCLLAEAIRAPGRFVSRATSGTFALTLANRCC